MSHLVRLTVSVEENGSVSQRGISEGMLGINQRTHHRSSQLPCGRIGETFIVNVTPAFSGGFAEFSSNPEHSHNFSCYWDAFEAATQLLLGKLNNNSIDGLLRSVLDTKPSIGSSFVIQAEVILNEKFFSGIPIPVRQVAEARFNNYAFGRYMSSYQPTFQSTPLGYKDDNSLGILEEFFKLMFVKAASSEPVYLKVAPTLQFPSSNGLITRKQFHPMMQSSMSDVGLYGHNPNFGSLVDIEDNVINNNSLFICVRLDGKNGNLTWFDVNSYSSGTVAFENSKVVCFEQMTSPITIMAARIVAHQLRGGNAGFISIHRAFDGFDFTNGSQDF